MEIGDEGKVMLVQEVPPELKYKRMLRFI